MAQSHERASQDIDSEESDSSVSSIFVEDLRTDLFDALEDISHAGTFASSNYLDSFIDPIICMNDCTPITLPLSELDAQALIKAAHQAPFGKGQETIVDTSVRNTWELNPEQFSLRNPLWKQYLDGIVATVTESLGIENGDEIVQAELYKMLLYEKGAMFKPHKDTEKCPGMFGTLVVCLPSKHTGGAVKVHHHGQSKEFRTEDFAQSVVYWYADVTHEITEVMSGYRWVLTYNLANKASKLAPSATFLRQDYRLLREVLMKWHRSLDSDFPTNEKELLYILEHQYTDASLNLTNLKGMDLVRAKVLNEICQETGFCFYLASLEHTITGQPNVDYAYGNNRYYDRYSEDEDDEDGEDEGYTGSHHDLGEVHDTTLELTRLTDLGGGKIAENIEVHKQMIVQVNPFDREPDDEDYEGYMGNSGPTATHVYHDTVFVILPRDRFAKFLLCAFQKSWNSDGVTGVIRYFFEKAETSSADEHRRNDLRQACKMVVDFNIDLRARQANLGYHHPHPDETVGLVAKASILLEDCDLLKKAVSCVSDRLPLSTFSELPTLLPKFGFAAIKDIFKTAFSHLSSISEAYAAVRELLSDQDKMFRAVRDCFAGLTFAFIGELGSISRDEGYAIVKRYGGEIILSPRSRTSYVVLGNGVDPKKLETIKKFKLQTIDEDGLFELIRGSPAREENENDPGSLDVTDVNASERLKLANWAISKLESVMSFAGNPCGKDGSVLVDYLIWRGGRLDCFSNAVSVAQKCCAQTPFAVTFLSHLWTAGKEGQLSQAAVIDAFKKVVIDVIEFFDVSKHPSEELVDGPSSKRQRTAYRYSHLLGNHKHLSAPVSGYYIATVVAGCLELHLEDSLTKLFAKLTSEANNINTSHFAIMLLPFLRSTIDILQKHSASLSSDSYLLLFRRIISSYILRYVGKEPTPPVSLTRPPVSCPCHDCAPLSRFLISPTQREGRFAMGKRRRQHLHIQLDKYGSSCTHETERFGNPQTLVVTKTNQEFDRNIADWTKRTEEFKKEVANFDQDQLRTLLGDTYEDVIGLKAVRKEHATQASATALVASARGGGVLGTSPPNVTPRALQGVKRKAAVVIDLTGDD